MSNYLYNGPRPSGVTLACGREVPLLPGQPVQDLDPAHPYVKTLVALGHLTGIAPEAPEIPAAEPAKRPKGAQP